MPVPLPHALEVSAPRQPRHSQLLTEPDKTDAQDLRSETAHQHQGLFRPAAEQPLQDEPAAPEYGLLMQRRIKCDTMFILFYFGWFILVYLIS